jgi:hypothetical protein
LAGGRELVSIKLSSLKHTAAREYLVRFFFGGAITVIAGLVAERCGVAVGGLFLAFPAIFPAATTLIEAHEKERKAKIGNDGAKRGRMAASLDAAGAALGCVGLAGFSLVLRFCLPHGPAWLAMALAMVGWVLISFSLWAMRRNRIFGRQILR